MKKVFRAAPYQGQTLGSYDQRPHMYIRQFFFPDEYADDEEVLSKDHEQQGLGAWFQKAPDEEILAFIQQIIGVPDFEATGYRVTCSVDTSSANYVWTLELFKKNPSSGTRVFTGEWAPNVQSDYEVYREQHPIVYHSSTSFFGFLREFFFGF